MCEAYGRVASVSRYEGTERQQAETSNLPCPPNKAQAWRRVGKWNPARPMIEFAQDGAVVRSMQ